MDESSASPIRRRNRNACDACRAQKVKCEYDGPMCRSCVALQIPCTRFRPRKKRGPLNRYVEAQRHVDTPSLTLSAETPSTQGIDTLGPPHIVDQIINDWFELIHSVAPILHRATFLRRMKAGDATQDIGFCNLVASICAATIASLRRKSEAYYDIITIERCKEVVENNGSQRRNGFTLEWCQTKYNLSVAAFSSNGVDDPDTGHLIAEALAGVKYLLYYELESMPFADQQLLKRLYWLIFAGQCTLGLHGRPYLVVVSPNDIMETLKPLEINDKELVPEPEGSTNDVGDWHGDHFSYIAGLNALTNLYMLWMKSQFESRNKIECLQDYMVRIHGALDNVPPELRWRGGLSRPLRSNFGTDVQTVNLYITQIHIRSFLLDQIDRLAKERGSTLAEVTIERQRLISDMLAIVYEMPEDTLEANGHSLVPKLRDIGMALLQEATNSADALVNLDRLLAKLDRLDFPPGSSRSAQTSPASAGI